MIVHEHGNLQAAEDFGTAVCLVLVRMPVCDITYVHEPLHSGPSVVTVHQTNVAGLVSQY